MKVKHSWQLEWKVILPDKRRVRRVREYVTRRACEEKEKELIIEFGDIIETNVVKRTRRFA